MIENKNTNRLINEKSPYLLQHAHNPVDWYPWGPEAFSRAVGEDKPIFLSIGYSTCHWCHVMERESFEDSEAAKFLNENFVSIKVDREERPDIDHIYMTVCQAYTGHGGWPLTIIMTPDKKPFYAGTYFPKHDRMGMPGLMTILKKISEIWNKDKNSLVEAGNEIINTLDREYESNEELNAEDAIHSAYSEFKYSFDTVYGGFGSAPKFPTPHNLYFLLRYWYSYKDDFALEMVEKTLDSMYRGGIFDHVGFGFSRYSTDRRWLVPHFEKMLYDNALLAIAYLETYQATGNVKYADIAKQIFTYVLRDMTSPEGGFFSAEDADSEGVEGKFYIWTTDEIKSVLGRQDGEQFCKYYDITQKGNFDGHSIPNLIKDTGETATKGTKSEFIEKCRTELFNYRENRVHPYKDDKILTAWNGLMIAALAMAGRVLDNVQYSKAAEKAVEFVLSKLVRSDGRLLARYRDGESAFPAYVDDYAFLVWGLLELYETTYKAHYLSQALKFNDDMIKYFWDKENGGLYLYGSDSEELIMRPKEIYDGAMPSGNSTATLNFLRLARLTGRSQLEDMANLQFKTFGNNLEQAPSGYAYMLSAVLFSHSRVREVVIVGNTEQRDTTEMLKAIREEFRPYTIPVHYSDSLSDLKNIIPDIENYKIIDGKATAYVCENFSCQSPVTEVNKLREML